jgi:hypothetical protein
VQAFDYPVVGEREGGGRGDVGVGRRRLCSDPTTTIVPPTEMVDEKEESGPSKMLTELNLADKYLHKLGQADARMKEHLYRQVRVDTGTPLKHRSWSGNCSHTV